MPEHKMFSLDKSLLSTLELLSDQEAGVLIKHIFKYAKDQTIEPKDRIIQVVFIPIKIAMNKFWNGHNLKDLHWNWKGGITPINRSIRNSTEIKKWRLDVFERDGYICQHCKIKGLKLNAHHIKEFAKFEHLRFEISNGLTLCEQCHINHHKELRNGKANVV